MTTTPPPGWEGILDPDEQIIWQGRPDGGFSMAPSKFFMAIFGVFFAGFALFWMFMAAQAGGIFWAFGLLHFSIGAWMTGNAVYGGTLRRRNTWYTLTNKRAFIATNLPFRGRKLEDFPINTDSRLEMVQGPPDTVWLGREYRSSVNSQMQRDVGFEKIENGAEVYRLIRDIKKGAA